MKNKLFKGVGTAIVTPFTEDGINLEEFGKLIENQIENGVKAIIVCGTTGESATMSKEEKQTLIDYAIKKVNNRIQVIVGTGSNNTKDTIEMSKLAENAGADGLLIVTPYYNKPTQAGLIAHYKAIAEAVNIPIMMYNVPSRTGVNIEPSTCLELSKIDNIVAIKEASGNMPQVKQIDTLCGNNLDIYSGNDDQIIPVLSLGGRGVVSVISNIMPKYTSDMLEYYWQGKTAKATSMQLEIIDMVNALFCESNPIPAKCALNELGYDYGTPRLPLLELSEPKKKVLRKVMKKHDLI